MFKSTLRFLLFLFIYNLREVNPETATSRKQFELTMLRCLRVRSLNVEHVCVQINVDGPRAPIRTIRRTWDSANHTHTHRFSQVCVYLRLGRARLARLFELHVWLSGPTYHTDPSGFHLACFEPASNLLHWSL